MLTGQAKKRYQRNYMRLKRAGLPTAKPRLTDETRPPTEREIDRIAFWVRNAPPRSVFARRIIGDLRLEYDAPENRDEAAWAEAVRRLRAHNKELREARENERKLAEAPPPPPTCTFCGKGEGKMLYGDRWRRICYTCAKKAIRTIEAGERRQRRQRK